MALASPLSTPGRAAPWGLVAVALALTALLLLPPAYLLLRALEAPPGEWRWLWHPRTWQLLRNSLGLAAAVTATAAALAVPLAWLVACTDLPGRRWWPALLSLPLAMPSYVGTFALVGALRPWFRVEGFWGAWWVLTLFTFPYVLLPVRAAWSRLDPALEEAARSLGASRLRRWSRVTLPHLGPSLSAGGLVVALYVLSDFGAVSLVRYETLTMAIYTQYAAAFDRSRAALLAGLLLVLTVALHRLEQAMHRREAAGFRVQPGAVRPGRQVRLGPWRWPAVAACAVVALASWGVPALSLVRWLVQANGVTQELSEVLASAAGSAVVAALAAAVASAAAFPLAYLTVRHPGRLARGVQEAAYLSFGLPGLAVALALVFFATRFATPLYQTLALLVVAHGLHFLPQALGAQRAALRRLNPHLEEVARSLGCSPAGVLRRVVWPLLRPGVVTGASLVFLTSMKELPSTLLLAPTGWKTLATLTWMHASEGFFGRAAVPGLVLLATSAISVAILLRFEGEVTGSGVVSKPSRVVAPASPQGL